MSYTWTQLTALKTDTIVLMVIEALVVIPLLCLLQWMLISKAERVRMLQWMLLVALPAPVLRTLSSRPAKVRESRAG